MRLLMLAAVAALAAPAVAQSPLADSSGLFLGVDPSIAYGGRSLGLIGSLDGIVGVRRANGVEYGLRGSLSRTDGYRGITVGPTVAITRPLDERTWLRTEGTVLYSAADYAQTPTSGLERSIRASSLSAIASVGLGREYRLGGSVAFHPSLSVYGRVGRATRWEATGFDDDWNGTPSEGLGLRLDLPVSFRVLGTDATLSLSPELPLVGGPSRLPARGGLRIRF